LKNQIASKNRNAAKGFTSPIGNQKSESIIKANQNQVISSPKRGKPKRLAGNPSKHCSDFPSGSF